MMTLFIFYPYYRIKTGEHFNFLDNWTLQGFFWLTTLVSVVGQIRLNRCCYKQHSVIWSGDQTFDIY